MPQALLAIGVGAAVGGTLFSAYSQSKAIKMQSEFESNQFETNSRLAELQAKDAEIRGDKDATNYKTQVKKFIGSQRAKMAAQGIDINEGSPLDVQEDTAALGAEDVLTIKNNAFREATGYRIQAIDLKGQAAFTRLAGKNASRNTLISGGLNAVSQLGMGAYQIKNYKVR